MSRLSTALLLLLQTVSVIANSGEAAEWSSLLSQASLNSDLALFRLGKSDIHGRGVIVSRDVRKGERLGTVWYDFFHSEEECRVPPNQLRGAQRGYLSNGGTVKHVSEMPLSTAIAYCQASNECKGLTFPQAGNFSSCLLGSAVQGECSDAPVVLDVEFKNHTNFVEYPGWTSFLKPARQVSYWPLGCNQQYPVGDDRLNMPEEHALGCWPRWVNHLCDANAHVVFADMPPDFVIPGLPWSKCVRAVTAVASRDIPSGSEITHNYEALPSYLVNNVPGVDACDASP